MGEQTRKIVSGEILSVIFFFHLEKTSNKNRLFEVCLKHSV